MGRKLAYLLVLVFLLHWTPNALAQPNIKAVSNPPHLGQAKEYRCDDLILVGEDWVYRLSYPYHAADLELVVQDPQLGSIQGVTQLSKNEIAVITLGNNGFGQIWSVNLATHAVYLEVDGWVGDPDPVALGDRPREITTDQLGNFIFAEGSSSNPVLPHQVVSLDPTDEDHPTILANPNRPPTAVRFEESGVPGIQNLIFAREDWINTPEIWSIPGDGSPKHKMCTVYENAGIPDMTITKGGTFGGYYVFTKDGSFGTDKVMACPAGGGSAAAWIDEIEINVGPSGSLSALEQLDCDRKDNNLVVAFDTGSQAKLVEVEYDDVNHFMVGTLIGFTGYLSGIKDIISLD